MRQKIQKKNHMIELNEILFKRNVVEKKKKILIVDDEEFNRYSLHLILEIVGVSNHQEIC